MFYRKSVRILLSCLVIAGFSFVTQVSADTIPATPTNFIVAGRESDCNTYSQNWVTTQGPTLSEGINIFWASSVGATGYKLYRSTSLTGTYTLIADTPETLFYDGGFASSTYYYKVLAYNTSGSSALSSSIISPGITTATTAHCTGDVEIVRYGADLSTSSAPSGTKIDFHGPNADYRTSLTNPSYLANIYSGYNSRFSAFVPSIPGYTVTMNTCTYPIGGTECSIPADLFNTVDCYESGDTGTEHACVLNAFVSTGNVTKVAVRYVPTTTTSTTIPATPQYLNVATGTSCGNKITISWGLSTGATNYRLFRSNTLGGAETELTGISIGPVSASFLDVVLSGQAQYYYRVSAVNGAGESPKSQAVSGTSSVQCSPTVVTGTSCGNKITISWPLTPGATNYKLFRSPTSNGTYTELPGISIGPVSASLLDVTPVSGSTYYYKFSVISPAGESDQSPYASASSSSYCSSGTCPAGQTRTITSTSPSCILTVTPRAIAGSDMVLTGYENLTTNCTLASATTHDAPAKSIVPTNGSTGLVVSPSTLTINATTSSTFVLPNQVASILTCPASVAPICDINSAGVVTCGCYAAGVTPPTPTPPAPEWVDVSMSTPDAFNPDCEYRVHENAGNNIATYGTSGGPYWVYYTIVDPNRLTRYSHDTISYINASDKTKIWIDDLVHPPTLFTGVNGLPLLGMQKRCSPANTWQPISLAGSQQFDLNYEYRNKVGSGTEYFTMVGQDDLIYMAHMNTIAYIKAVDKYHFYLNQNIFPNASAPYTIDSIERRTRASEWTPISMTSTDSFDPTCEYREKMTIPASWASIYGIAPGTYWQYPREVGPDDLIYISHNGFIDYVKASNKTVGWNNLTQFTTFPVDSIEKRCPPSAPSRVQPPTYSCVLDGIPGCSAGQYFCSAENICKPAGQPCSPVTCNNNGTCDANEGCNCADCNQAPDHCGLDTNGNQMLCTKDTATALPHTDVNTYFGGIYGGPAWVNPATGESSCPAGYNATKVAGIASQDFNLYVCTRSFTDRSTPLPTQFYDFGGMWGMGSTLTGYTRDVNPYTGAQTCPTGFTKYTALGFPNLDYTLYYCMRTRTTAPTLATEDFGGLWGMQSTTTGTGTPYNNPVTSAPSCPLGYTTEIGWGTDNVDGLLRWCFNSTLTLPETPLVPEWVDVPLTDTNPFDPECQYRVQEEMPNSYARMYGIAQGNYWTYYTGVDANRLTRFAHTTITYINATDKTKLWFDDTVHTPTLWTTWTFSRIQRRCFAANTWEPVSVTGNQQFDINYEYRNKTNSAQFVGVANYNYASPNVTGTEYFGMVGTDDLVYMAHMGLISYVKAVDKTHFYVNLNIYPNATTPIVLSSIERRSRASEWKPVSLTSTTPFNSTCEYRTKMSIPSSYTTLYGISSGSYWAYATQVGTDDIIYTAHNGVVGYTKASNKAASFVNLTQWTLYPNDAIEERCSTPTTPPFSLGKVVARAVGGVCPTNASAYTNTLQGVLPNDEICVRLNYQNRNPVAITNVGVTDSLDPAQGFTYVPGSTKNCLSPNGTPELCADNAAMAGSAWTGDNGWSSNNFTLAPHAGFYGQSATAATATMEMGKTRYIHMRSCGLSQSYGTAPGVWRDTQISAVTNSLADIGECADERTEIPAVPGDFRGYTPGFDTLGKRYFHIRTCGVGGNFRDTQISAVTNDSTPSGTCVVESWYSGVPNAFTDYRPSYDTLGNRYDHIRTCGVDGDWRDTQVTAMDNSTTPSGTCVDETQRVGALAFNYYIQNFDNDFYDPENGRGYIQYKIKAPSTGFTGQIVLPAATITGDGQTPVSQTARLTSGVTSVTSPLASSSATDSSFTVTKLLAKAVGGVCPTDASVYVANLTGVVAGDKVCVRLVYNNATSGAVANALLNDALPSSLIKVDNSTKNCLSPSGTPELCSDATGMGGAIGNNGWLGSNFSLTPHAGFYGISNTKTTPDTMEMGKKRYINDTQCTNGAQFDTFPLQASNSSSYAGTCASVFPGWTVSGAVSFDILGKRYINNAQCHNATQFDTFARQASNSSSYAGICDTHDWNGAPWTVSGAFSFDTLGDRYINASQCHSATQFDTFARQASNSSSYAGACDTHPGFTVSGAFSFDTLDTANGKGYVQYIVDVATTPSNLLLPNTTLTGTLLGKTTPDTSSANATINSSGVQVPEWVDVPLTSTTSYDPTAEYRFKINAVNFGVTNVPNGDYWFYATGVGANEIIYVSHAGKISHLTATSKGTYRVNGVPVTSLNPSQIQKRVTPGLWSDVPLTSTDSFDPTAEYRMRHSNIIFSPLGVSDGEYWLHATGVGANNMIYIYHNNFVSYTNANDKGAFFWNTGPWTPLNFAQIQKRTTPSKWTDVSLTSTSNFNATCEYRFRVNNGGVSGYGLTNGDFWYYATGVSSGGIIYISHDGHLSHVNADSKTIFRWDGTALPSLPVSQVQERCFITDPVSTNPVLPVTTSDSSQFTIRKLLAKAVGGVCPTDASAYVPNLTDVATGDKVCVRLVYNNATSGAVSNALLTDVLPAGFTRDTGSTKNCLTPTGSSELCSDATGMGGVIGNNGWSGSNFSLTPHAGFYGIPATKTTADTMEMGKKLAVYSNTCRYALNNDTTKEVDFTYLSDVPQTQSSTDICPNEAFPKFLYNGAPQNRVSGVNILGRPTIASHTCRYAYNNDTTNEVDFVYIGDTLQSLASICPSEVPAGFLYNGAAQDRVSQINMLGKRTLASKTCRYAYSNDTSNEVDFTYLWDTPQNMLTSDGCPAEVPQMYTYNGAPQNRGNSLDLLNTANGKGYIQYVITSTTTPSNLLLPNVTLTGTLTGSTNPSTSTSNATINSSSIQVDSQIGACCPAGSAWNSVSQSCVPGTCSEGQYFCSTENVCKTPDQVCGTITCNNNGICDANESCNCGDCNQQADHCGLDTAGHQLVCTKDTAPSVPSTTATATNSQFTTTKLLAKAVGDVCPTDASVYVPSLTGIVANDKVCVRLVYNNATSGAISNALITDSVPTGFSRIGNSTKNCLTPSGTSELCSDASGMGGAIGDNGWSSNNFTLTPHAGFYAIPTNKTTGDTMEMGKKRYANYQTCGINESTGIGAISQPIYNTYFGNSSTGLVGNCTVASSTHTQPGFITAYDLLGKRYANYQTCNINESTGLGAISQPIYLNYFGNSSTGLVGNCTSGAPTHTQGATFAYDLLGKRYANYQTCNINESTGLGAISQPIYNTYFGDTSTGLVGNCTSGAPTHTQGVTVAYDLLDTNNGKGYIQYIVQATTTPSNVTLPSVTLTGTVAGKTTSDTSTSSAVINPGTQTGQTGACCPAGKQWNSATNSCESVGCTEGQYFCSTENVCKAAGDTCGTITCNNNGTCDANESCDCGDCNNQVDHCGLNTSGVQLVCTKDNVPHSTLVSSQVGACCPAPKTWNSTTNTCVECSQTQAPSQIRSGLDQPYITCTGNGDTTKTHFRYKITPLSGTGTPYISDIKPIGTAVLHIDPINQGDYRVECFYGTAGTVDTNASPDSCVKNMTVASNTDTTIQGCSSIYAYKGTTLSNEMTSADPFNASFRCGSRLPSNGLTNPYILNFGTQNPAFLQYDSIMSALFGELSIGPVSTQTQDYAIPTGTTNISCAVKVGGGYSTNNSCRIQACAGGVCSIPDTFSVVNSSNALCTTNDEDDYNIGCNPEAPQAARDACVKWFQDNFTARANTGVNTFSLPFIINNITRTIDCTKYPAGSMPGGLNMYDNYVCTTRLPNGQTVDLFSGDKSLQTTAYTVKKDRENPRIGDIKYFTDSARTNLVTDITQWQKKNIIAEVTCMDTPLDESAACACARTVDPSTTQKDAWSDGIPDPILGGDVMKYTRTFTDSVSTQNVQVVDTAKNQSPVTTFGISIDTHPPLITLSQSGSSTNQTITIQATDNLSKIWKTATAPLLSQNTDGIIYRKVPKDTASSALYDVNCGVTNPVYAAVSDTTPSNSATATIANVNPNSDVVVYCVQDNAGNVTRGMYPSQPVACFASTNMTTIPTLSTYSSLLQTRIAANQFGYGLSEDTSNAACFRGILSLNIATFVTNQYDPNTATSLDWSRPANLKNTSTSNTNGYYYYSFNSSGDSTVTLPASNPNGSGQKVVVVDGGNIQINSNIDYSGSDKTLVLIARKTSKGGNIYINPSVTHIDAILIADGAIMNATTVNPSASTSVTTVNNWIDTANILNNRLTINGRLYSFNTRGGSLVVNGTDFGPVTGNTGKYFDQVSIRSDGTPSLAASMDLERFRLIQPDGDNTCSLNIGYRVFTNASLPTVLQKPAGYTGGSCSF